VLVTGVWPRSPGGRRDRSAQMPQGHGGDLVFESLPIHPTIVRNDADYIHNNIRMNLLRAHEDFLASADPDRLVASLRD
jgi:hypothetical protein